jgi:predicted ABC-type ATPase
VFSHPSKLELVDAAKAAGYVVVLHVLMIPEDLAVHRVHHRVQAGGHDVPEEKTRQRYRRLWDLAAAAAARTDAATFYDNSAVRGPRIVARMHLGFADGAVTWPRWAPTTFTTRWSA